MYLPITHLATYLVKGEKLDLVILKKNGDLFDMTYSWQIYTAVFVLFSGYLHSDCFISCGDSIIISWVIVSEAKLE